ncbi:MAG: hypothetical protein GYA55_10415, partial [SAR324 cluster bacterium]|nr:hypothetical protein [SAR324 cluster bacterium]
KRIILTAINAKYHYKAICSLHNFVKNDKRLTKALEESGFSGKDLQTRCAKFYYNFLSYHSPIRKSIGTGIGTFLQAEDSKIASDILWYFTRQDIPVLPVHDSFIIAERHEEALRQVMQNTYKSYFGFAINVERK